MNILKEKKKNKFNIDFHLVVVQVPVVVVDELKRKAEEEDKAFPDMIREILAEAAK